MSVKDRIIEVINFKRIAVSTFEANSGLSNGYIKNLKDAPSAIKLEDILNAYPDINRVWLLTGEGEMLRTEQKTENFSENNSGVSNVSGNGNRIKNEVTTPTAIDPTIDKILKEMSEERKSHTAQVDKLLAQLEAQNRLIEKLMDK